MSGTVKSNLTSEKILENAMDQAIPMYLREGETVQLMLNRFNGDKVEAVKFLRERAFKSEEELNQKDVSKKPVKKAVNKSKVVLPPDKKEQKELF